MINLRNYEGKKLQFYMYLFTHKIMRKKSNFYKKHLYNYEKIGYFTRIYLGNYENEVSIF